MKQKDVALVILIAFVSAVLSLVLSRILFTSSQNQQEAQVVPVITASFPSPDSRYFNNNSIDPTQLIQIGNNNNQNPFNGSGQ
jgi:hypothetical protein